MLCSLVENLRRTVTACSLSARIVTAHDPDTIYDWLNWYTIGGFVQCVDVQPLQQLQQFVLLDFD